MSEVIIERCPAVRSAFEAFWKMRGQRHVVFLDSALPDARWGRRSIVACDPVVVFEARGDTVGIKGGTIHFEAPGNPFTALRDLARRFRSAGIPAGSDGEMKGTTPAGMPALRGAFIGYFGYGLRQFVERVPARIEDDTGAADAWFGVYDRLLVFDHERNEATIVSTGVNEFGQPDARRARQRADELIQLLSVPAILPAAGLPAGGGGTDLEVRSTSGRAPNRRTDFQVRLPASLNSNFTRDDYERTVERAREYIAAGDVYQINLSQRFECETKAEPAMLYHALRSANAAPFAAFLDCGDVQVLSSSPERFVQFDGRHVQTRPIKGTRPRIGDAAADERAARELMASVKDRAELLMIIDLERNDLGRVCDYGSVRVPELMTMESYATVFHLVSTVEGRLAESVETVDAVRALFPGGSITGAPKIRAMEIIDELEPSARGVYTGAIGWLGFNGDADLNIAIRTLVHRDGRVWFHAGGGIVADSVPSLEYEETLHKARGMMRALGCAEV
ncbi:MAG: aminodeoxychorismate synthase component I [Verrucomicrobia bacterium]|nr:aminodeoxychorismate synthase component I [Verrucomicrobiota bacterium]